MKSGTSATDECPTDSTETTDMDKAFVVRRCWASHLYADHKMHTNLGPLTALYAGQALERGRITTLTQTQRNLGIPEIRTERD